MLCFPPCSYAQQGLLGDNTTERPMWAEKGGLDFDGRSRWDAWDKLKGMKQERARVNFVKVREGLWALKRWGCWSRVEASRA